MCYYYTVYKTTNLVNGKIYIGVHKTENLEDGYLGSGKSLSDAIKKYGRKNFKKEYLAIFDNPEEMFEMESKLVDRDFIKNENTYNICLGGHGGWDWEDEENREFLQECVKKGSKKWKKSFDSYKQFCNYMWELGKKGNKINQSLYPEGTFKGKNHTEESKRKMGEKNSKHQQGSKNSQYGTMWIYNPELKENKKINKDEPIPEGWYKGRKMKFQ